MCPTTCFVRKGAYTLNNERYLIKREEVDGFLTLYEILLHAKNKYPNKIAYRQLESRTEEKTVTFGAFADDVDALRVALAAEGLCGKHLAVCGEGSIEWLTVYLAVTAGVGVCIPIDRELSPETMAKQLDFADTDFVFCSARSIKKMQKALALCEKRKTVAIMRSDDTSRLDNGCERVTTLTELINKGKSLSAGGKSGQRLKIDPDKTSVIIYTSGTTGANKGVELSNRNVMGTLRGCARLLHFPETSISVLPVNHSYELHAHLMSCLYCGTTVSFNDDLKHILKNLERFSPEMSCMVPMMLDLIVRKLKKGIADAGKEKKFEKAVRFSNALRKLGLDFRQRLFAELTKPLGGKLKMIISGGAALSQDTANFLENVGITVYNGYGITECSPVVAVNPGARVKKNSVGLLLPTMRVRINKPDELGNGELQLFGDNVMKGYYKAPEDTERVFTADGWFCTGDIGHVDSDNFVYISGRLKNLIILPNGKNIYPEEIEDALMKRIPYISECVVYADEGNTGIYAIVFLDRSFAEENGLDTPEKQKSFMKKDVDLFNGSVPSFKRIADYDITDREFEKSSSHKIQRFKIAAVR